MINAKLENAVAIGPHLVEMRQAGGDERSSGKGKQRDAASGPAFRLPETRRHGCPYFGHHLVRNQIPRIEPLAYFAGCASPATNAPTIAGASNTDRGPRVRNPN